MNSGPTPSVSNNNTDRADLMSYLERDFNTISSKAEDSSYKGEMLKNEVKHLQNILPAFGFPIIGDLFSISMVDIEATIRWYTLLLLHMLNNV